MAAAVTLPATLRTEADRIAITETIDADGIEVFARWPARKPATRPWRRNWLWQTLSATGQAWQA